MKKSKISTREKSGFWFILPAMIFVFLLLAAQYESWSLPLAVILVVPMCLLSAIVGVNLAKMDINIFTQIGFVVLVGLASKNAILIVEFAKMQMEKEGMPVIEAALVDDVFIISGEKPFGRPGVPALDAGSRALLADPLRFRAVDPVRLGADRLAHYERIL